VAMAEAALTSAKKGKAVTLAPWSADRVSGKKPKKVVNKRTLH